MSSTLQTEPTHVDKESRLYRVIVHWLEAFDNLLINVTMSVPMSTKDAKKKSALVAMVLTCNSGPVVPTVNSEPGPLMVELIYAQHQLLG
jgi:hypothetical protein